MSCLKLNQKARPYWQEIEEEEEHTAHSFR